MDELSKMLWKIAWTNIAYEQDLWEKTKIESEDENHGRD